jgi:hypothetical protein
MCVMSTFMGILTVKKYVNNVIMYRTVLLACCVLATPLQCLPFINFFRDVFDFDPRAAVATWLRMRNQFLSPSVQYR